MKPGGKANLFGTRASVSAPHLSGMSGVGSLLAETTAPSTTVHDVLDVRELPPPEPLQVTLEALTELDDDAVVVQMSDRSPSTCPRASTTGASPTTPSSGTTAS